MLLMLKSRDALGATVVRERRGGGCLPNPNERDAQSGVSTINNLFLDLRGGFLDIVADRLFQA